MGTFNPKTPSKGLGDSIAKLTHFLKLDILASKIARVLGKEDCGCERRRIKLNHLISYENIDKEEYTFTDPKLFEVLEDIELQTKGTLIVYKKGEKILIDPSLPVYYSLRYLLSQEKIRPYAT